MPEPLTIEEVRHIARLARLRLSDDEIETYRTQLSVVLEHIDRLGRLDLEGVEPLASPAQPAGMRNRLNEDEIDSARLLTIEQIARNAPAMEGRFIAVPKVIGDAES